MSGTAGDDGLLAHVLVPVAHPDDAETTARALAGITAPHRVTVLHVVERAGGAPDTTPVERSEQLADEAFAIVRERFPDATGEVRYGADVVGTILEATRDIEATAIAFRPRAGGTIARLLTGDLSTRLIREADRPVIALPDPDAGGDDRGG